MYPLRDCVYALRVSFLCRMNFVFSLYVWRVLQTGQNDGYNWDTRRRWRTRDVEKCALNVDESRCPSTVRHADCEHSLGVERCPADEERHQNCHYKVPTITIIKNLFWHKNLDQAGIHSPVVVEPFRTVVDFLPAPRYASAGLCESNVSVRLSVRHERYCVNTKKASVMISHHLVAPRF